MLFRCVLRCDGLVEFEAPARWLACCHRLSRDELLHVNFALPVHSALPHLGCTSTHSLTSTRPTLLCGARVIVLLSSDSSTCTEACQQLCAAPSGQSTSAGRTQYHNTMRCDAQLINCTAWR